MVTDWVTQSLAQTDWSGCSDTRSLLTETGDVRELADRANVTYLITGSVFRQGDSLRFTAQLTDAHSGSIANPINVTAPASEPTAALKELEQRVTGALAVMVDPKLSNYTATSSRPPTWEAYQEFLLGMRAFRRPYDSALARFRRAAVLDTSYMQARLWAGSALGNLRNYAEADSIFRTVAARRDQMAPYDRATLEYFHDGFVRGDWETAYNGAKQMVELAPAAGHALWALGLTARITSRPREGIAAMERIDVSAGWGREWAVRIFGEINRDHHILGELEKALAATRRMLEFAPSDGYARTEEVVNLAALKRYAELAERVEAAGALPDDPTTWEAFSGGDLLSRVARELRVHGAPPDTVRRYAEAAVKWYATPTAAGLAGHDPPRRSCAGRLRGRELGRGEADLRAPDGDQPDYARLDCRSRGDRRPVGGYRGRRGAPPADPEPPERLPLRPPLTVGGHCRDRPRSKRPGRPTAGAVPQGRNRAALELARGSGLRDAARLSAVCRPDQAARIESLQVSKVSQVSESRSQLRDVRDLRNLRDPPTVTHHQATISNC
jgi:tetratricopeptide (TPR) repeat protein